MKLREKLLCLYVSRKYKIDLKEFDDVSHLHMVASQLSGKFHFHNHCSYNIHNIM